MNRNEIANLTLSNLAQNITVSDFNTDHQLAARILRQWWRVSLKQFLSKHPWNFATSYAALPVGLSTPSAGFAYAYAKPSDALVIRRLAYEGNFPKGDVQEEYARRWKEINVGTGTEIWCDVENAHAEYTVAIGDDYDFPDHFALGFSYFLALKIGPKLITQNWPKIVQNITSMAKDEIDASIATDLAMQPDALEFDSSFITLRGQC